MRRAGPVRRDRLDTRLAGGRAEVGDPADRLAGELDARTQVGAAMVSLSADDREVLQLWAWEDLDAAGMAAVLDCSPGTARTRLHRAKTRLRSALTPDVPMAEGQ